jgi:pteridine reductase
LPLFEVTVPPTKVALVTGAGKRRVGSVVAEALARRGYAIMVHYRSSAVEAGQTIENLKKLGVAAQGFQGDISDELVVQRMVKTTLDAWGRLDVLVNAAAVWRRKPLEQISAADVRLHFETNTLGSFLCAQHAGLAMVKQPEGGCIINIGDWAENRPYLDYAAYFPSKGAVTTMTRSLAVELGTRNPRIRVNCIMPGPVMLPPDLPEAEKQEAINATLVKKEGSPQNIAQAVLSLIDNDFITGVCLPVDGGRTIYAG